MQKLVNIIKKTKNTKKPNTKKRVMVNGIPKYGSRPEVFHGNAMMTTGKLTKNDLVKNKHGYIKSKKKVQQAKDPKTNPLLKMGLLAKKGSKEFGPNMPNNNSKSNPNSNSNNMKSKSNSNSNNMKSNKSKSNKNKKSNIKKKSKSRSSFLGLF